MNFIFLNNPKSKKIEEIRTLPPTITAGNEFNPLDSQRLLLEIHVFV